jgi:thiosulfate/3-mercaptopyruvate sulfurtransferase
MLPTCALAGGVEHGHGRMSCMAADLISVDELAQLIRTGAAPVLLDVRWVVGSGSDEQAYRAGHLPDAVFVDLDRDLADPPGLGGRHPLPAADRLQAVWRRSGISDGRAVVVYDGGDGSGAVRAWWLARWSGLPDVRVLDGGLTAWQAAGEVLHLGEVHPEPGAVTVASGGMPTVDADLAQALALGADTVLLDARAAVRYRGEVEPLDTKAGHIPGATNLPFADLYTLDGRLRPADELRSAFEAAGVRPGMTAAASCGSGITAGHLVLAGRVAGLDLALYPGSFSQWCALDRPVVAGPAAV